ncbi:MAG: HEAT repeat domain-containing protein [Deltaproteobacteria bacterium]|nr:HEAT repeat domain-containing protein [Deltaproteobacteria bacterium]
MLARTLKNLASSDASKRRGAVEALSNWDERGIYPLVKALSDSHPGVQDAAMRSLIAIGGEAVAWAVLPLLRGTSIPRNMAMVILKEIGKDAVPLLAPLVKDKDEDVRKFAIDLIADAGARELEQALTERLSGDPNPNVRAAAAQALGKLGCREALPALIAALKDMEWIRFTALDALATLKDPAAVEPILSLLSDSSPATRCAAIEALGAIGSPRAGDALLASLGEAERDERAVYLKSILRLGVPLPLACVSGDLLEIFRSEGEWEDRLVALRALVEIADEEILRSILDIAGSLDTSNPEEEEILASIKKILGAVRRPETLQRILGDSSLRFRARVVAAEVIGERGLREAVPGLVALLKGDVRDVRRAAASALLRIGDGGAREAFVEAIRDPDGHVRKAAAEALGASGDKAAFGPLLSLFREEKYEDVAEEVFRALAAIDPEELVASAGVLEGRAREMVEEFARGRGGGSPRP